jgi:hypothetical protein
MYQPGSDLVCNLASLLKARKDSCRMLALVRPTDSKDLLIPVRKFQKRHYSHDHAA